MSDEALEVEPQDPPADPPADPPEDNEPDVETLLQARESHQEELASQRGWQPLVDWVKAGNKAEDWRPAGEFNLVGEFGNKFKQKDREYEEKLQGVSKIHQAQIAILKQGRDKAIDDGDKEAVKDYDQQISDLQQPAPRTDPTLDNWNSSNPWIMDDTPKAAYAKQKFAQYTSSGTPVAQAITLMESDIAQKFPSKPQGKVPPSESGKSKGFKRSAPQVTMSDLSSEEKTIWKHMSGNWDNDEAKFLKSVTEARKGVENA